MIPPDQDDCTSQRHPTRPVMKRQTTEAKAYITTLPQEIRNLLAGGIAGMVAKTIVAPVDRIKILYQVSSRVFHLADVPKIAYAIIKEEGPKALWKGNTATMVRVFPYSGIQFMVFDRCKAFFLQKHEEKDVLRKKRGEKRRPWGLSAMESLAAGATAGVCSAFVTYPLDMTRAQLAVMKNKKFAHNMGFIGILAKNYRDAGIIGLYRGITPTMLGMLPYAGLAFALNEQTKRKIQNMLGREPTTVEKMQSGALAGLIAQTVTYPLEVTRRRMQTMGVACGKDAAVGSLGLGHAQEVGTNTSPKSVGMVWTMQQVIKEQGMRGLFKGVSLNWFKGPVAFSISFTTYDYLKAFLATEAERLHRMPRRRTTR